MSDKGVVTMLNGSGNDGVTEKVTKTVQSCGARMDGVAGPFIEAIAEYRHWDFPKDTVPA